MAEFSQDLEQADRQYKSRHQYKTVCGNHNVGARIID